MQAIMTMPFFYRFRDALATLPAIVILAILIFAGIQKAVKIQPHTDDSLVQIALTEPEPPVAAPTPPTPTPPQVVKPLPVPAVQPIQNRQPTPATPQPTVSATPVSNSPSAEVAAPPAAPKAVAAPAPIAPPAPEPAPPVTKPNNAGVEAGYIAKLRAHLNSIKRYPTGREASQQRPQGKVKVWFVLNRDGTLVEQGIDESSNSMLLDEAARKTINRATFSAFPESSWVGEASHRFSAELEFIPGAG
ncbi:TonB family protein [Collimonas sp.]|jgi:protein TonB|uniref:TonB family protein n=1 Tax=Collimonas sp. TaxID=1963772 RepID=UPI002CE14A6C|nr:TonB family protein [Collimonas sp.]HWW06489.1 TonB family protein [Collimonas sp.]